MAEVSVHVALLWLRRLLGTLVRSEMLLVRRQAIGHLVATDVVIDAMTSPTEKRTRVLASRERAYAKVLSLFDIPFHRHPLSAEYTGVRRKLRRLFGFDGVCEQEAT